MKDKIYGFVIQFNSIENTNKLLGYNLNDEETNNLFYSLGRDNLRSSGQEISGDAHLRNIKGWVCEKIDSYDKAVELLITIPNQFNSIIKHLNVLGYDVVKKGIVHKNMKTISHVNEEWYLKLLTKNKKK